MNARDVAAAALAAAPHALYVAALGTAVSALRAASDDGPHLYFGGAMGSCLAASIGIAEERPDRDVVALLGDGEVLLGASALWALKAIRPPNLVAVVLADGRYSITGGQELPTDPAFVAVAAALGLRSARCHDAAEIGAAIRASGPALVEAVVTDDAWPGPSPFVDPALVGTRFREACAQS